MMWSVIIAAKKTRYIFNVYCCLVMINISSTISILPYFLLHVRKHCTSMIDIYFLLCDSRHAITLIDELPMAYNIVGAPFSSKNHNVYMISFLEIVSGVYHYPLWYNCMQFKTSIVYGLIILKYQIKWICLHIHTNINIISRLCFNDYMSSQKSISCLTIYMLEKQTFYGFWSGILLTLLVITNMNTFFLLYLYPIQTSNIFLYGAPSITIQFLPKIYWSSFLNTLSGNLRVLDVYEESIKLYWHAVKVSQLML